MASQRKGLEIIAPGTAPEEVATGIVAKEDPPDNRLLNFLLRPRPLSPILDPILALAQVTISITGQEPGKEEVSATMIRMATVEEERHADFCI